MEIQEYINQVKKVYKDVLIFIEDDEYNHDSFNQLVESIKVNKIQDSKDEFENFIRIIVNISNNHHRNSGFFDKIKQILHYFEEDIKRFFSNLAILKLFESSKILLLYLFEKKIVIFDDVINKIIENKAGNDDIRYYHFFLPEIIEFQTNDKKSYKGKLEKELSSIENYEEKRRIGENDSYVCSLIRQDCIDEFIKYFNETNLSLLSKIKKSIFETNSFLIDNEPTLIEYATFFGSIQIFQYLRMNNVELSQSLWLYAVHSNNAEMINFLEEKGVIPPDNSYEACIIEAIKCHHNDIAIYIRDNLLNGKNSSSSKMIKKVVDTIYHYYNYEFFNEADFFYLCQYNYTNIVNHLLEIKKNYIESKIISSIYILIKFQFKIILYNLKLNDLNYKI